MASPAGTLVSHEPQISLRGSCQPFPFRIARSNGGGWGSTAARFGTVANNRPSSSAPNADTSGECDAKPFAGRQLYHRESGAFVVGQRGGNCPDIFRESLPG